MSKAKSSTVKKLDGARKDIQQQITDAIVEAIEKGVEKYQMPWHQRLATGMPINASSRKSYRGANVLMLWAVAQEKGYSTNLWATYNQWEQMGAQVRKGEKSTHVAFWKFFKEEEKAGEKQGEDGKAAAFAMARSYCVFNADQVDGWEGRDKFELPVTPELHAERIEEADQFFKATGADIREGGNRAYYSPAGDFIQMPPFTQFKKADYFYSVLAHEVTHWTMAASRLNRSEGLGKRFGSEGYAMEELVAELGAAFLSAELGLELEARRDHAPYVKNWLSVLKNDKRAIFSAATKAQQAVDFILAKQPSEMEEEEAA